MRRLAPWLLLLVALGCGRYGPPLRPSERASAETAPAEAPAAPADADEESEEEAP